MRNLHYEALIIGFGKGGKTLAGKLAASGKSVALVERDRLMYGGTCINVGCIPSKSLIFSASKVSPSASFEEKSAAYSTAIKKKRQLTAMLRQKNYDKLAALPNVTIYNGTAKFTGPLEVEVIPANDFAAQGSTAKKPLQLTAEQIFINTGSVSRIPPIEGIKNISGNLANGVYTSTELMELDTLPEHLVIIGGGYIGLEFASMYSGFGSKVTVLQDSEVFLPREDGDMAEEIKSILQERGIEFCFGAEIKKITAGPTVNILHRGKEKMLKADAVLVATGRSPNTAALNCKAAGIRLNDRGAVEVNEYLSTSAHNVWAMGDVVGGLQHTYISLDHARIIWPQLVGEEARKTSAGKNIPYSVFLATPYSRVGMNETEARQAGYNVKVLELPAAAIPKAQVLAAPNGKLKAVIDKDSDKLLGAMLLCEESYEIINVVKLAMDMDADYRILRDQIFTHPTMTEALNDLFSL